MTKPFFELHHTGARSDTRAHASFLCKSLLRVFDDRCAGFVWNCEFNLFSSELFPLVHYRGKPVMKSYECLSGINSYNILKAIKAFY